MKKSIAVLGLIFLLSSCKFFASLKPDKSKSALISSKNWQIMGLKDGTGRDLRNDNLNPQARALYNIDFTFFENKIVRASDRVSKQILNQGTWSINTEETVINFDIEGFKGDFAVITATNKQLNIRYDGTSKIAGLGTGLTIEMTPID